MFARFCRCVVPLLLALVLLPGCSQRDRGSDRPEGVKVSLTVEPDPPAVGPARATVKLTDAEGKPLRGATLKLEGNMNHAGMKPVFADARETRTGEYEADLELTMGGDWFILITGTLEDGRKLKEKKDLPGVKSE